MVRYVQQLYDPSNGDQVELAVDFTTRRLRIGGTSRTFKSVPALERAYVEEAAALFKRRVLRDLENGPARVADLARMRADARVKVPPPHRALAKLGAAYAIALDHGGSGRSKVGGDPDLPASFTWPGERMFVAQLDLAEVAPFDVSKWLPRTGLIHYFINEDCTDNLAVYTTAKVARREAPRSVKKLAERFYKRELVERRLAFRGVLLPREDFADEDEEIDLARLSKQLGIEVTMDDTDDRMFGEPAGEPGIDVFSDPEPPDDPADPATWLDYDGPRTLALQLRFSNGRLYLGVPPSDLKRGDLSRARATYSGT